MDVVNKVAVVTGASSGIGHATASRLARSGMRVVAMARRAERLDELSRVHTGVKPYVIDVTDTEAMYAAAAWVEESFGACHVLVNNAGIGGDRFAGAESLDDVAATMDVNFFGVVRGMAAFHDLLAASAPSQIVNVASVAGKLGIGPAGYAASKFAVVGFSEAVGLDWKREGITVTQLNPGFIKTEGFSQEQVLATPAARLVGDPELVADAILAAILSGATERTVPRWYKPMVTMRHLAPSVFWRVAGKLPRAAGHRN